MKVSEEISINFSKERLWKAITDIENAEATENTRYHARAENHGSVYITELSLAERPASTLLRMTFCGMPQTVVAKLLRS